MVIEIWRKEQSMPIVITDATDAYEKGSFYCVYQKDQKRTQKYPIADIFRVIESYPDEVRRNIK